MANYDPSTVAFARDWFLQCAAQTNMHYSLEGKLVLAAVSNEPGHPNKEWLCEIEIQKVLARLRDPQHPERFSIGQLMTARSYKPSSAKRHPPSPERSPSPTRRSRTPLPKSHSPVRGTPRIQISPSPMPSASVPIKGEAVSPEPAVRRSASPLDTDALQLIQEEVTLARQQANAVGSGLRLSTNSTTGVPPEASLDEVAARYGHSRGVFDPVTPSGHADISRLVEEANRRFLDIHHQQLHVQQLVDKLAQTYPLDRFNQVDHQNLRVLSLGSRSLTFELTLNEIQSAPEGVEALHQKILQRLNKHLKEVGFADEGAPHLIKYVRKYGALPATLEHRLSIRQEALKWQVAQLIYLAIAFRKEPRSSTFKPATFKELQWMFQGDAEEDTRRLLSFIKTVAEEIGHSTLSVQQAKWGSCFQSLFNGQAKEHQEIYAEAGSGKTTAVNFFLKDFHRRFPEKRVIYLSPLPKAEDPTRADWLQFIQLDPGASVNGFPLPDGWTRENLVVIVDEAHCLKPGEDLLVQEQGQNYRVPQYLRITATPISSPMKVQAAYQATEASLRDQINRCEALSQEVNQYLSELDQKASHLKRMALLRYLLKTVEKAGHPRLAWLPSSLPPLEHYGYKEWHQACLEKQDDLDQLAHHLTQSCTGHCSAVVSNPLFRTSVEQALGKILGTRSLDYERWSSAIVYVFGSKEDPVKAYRSSFLSAPIAEVFGNLVNPSADHEVQKKDYEALLRALIQTRQKLQEKLFAAERKSQDPQILEAVTKYEEEQVKRCQLLGRRITEVSPHKALGVERHQQLRTLRHQMQVHQLSVAHCEGLQAAAIEMLFRQLETVSEYRRVQMILPGVGLTEENVRLLAERVAPRKAVFLCSEPGVNFGKKLIFIEGAFHELSDERIADQDSVLMLYDHYTKQGGDFGKLSLSSSGQTIAQLIFLNLAKAGQPLPSELMSEVDLCQALYRARGAFTDSHVYCLEEQATLLRRLEEKQKQREKLVARSDVTCAVVNRILAAQRAVQEALEKAHLQGSLRAALTRLQGVIHLDETITSMRLQRMVQASFALLQVVFTQLGKPLQESAEGLETLMEIYQHMADASHLLQEAERLLIENREALGAVEAARAS